MKAELKTEVMSHPGIEKPSWQPFAVAERGSKADLPRSLDTFEGIGDRLRSAAFAELQAREAFLWAASHYDTVSSSLKQAWRELAQAEDRHLKSLLNRLVELSIPVEARKVSDLLWVSLTSCKTPREFALYMASAEQRGQKAGFRFHQALQKADPITAEIFRVIAEEEQSHIELADRFFPA